MSLLCVVFTHLEAVYACNSHPVKAVGLYIPSTLRGHATPHDTKPHDKRHTDGVYVTSARMCAPQVAVLGCMATGESWLATLDPFTGAMSSPQPNGFRLTSAYALPVEIHEGNVAQGGYLLRTAKTAQPGAGDGGWE